MIEGIAIALKSTGGKILGVVKPLAANPVLAAVVLGGIIGYEFWKGKKDALEPDATAVSDA